jgi:hypothetical protein
MESYGIALVAATVADLLNTVGVVSDTNEVLAPSYVTMHPTGHVGFQFRSGDDVRAFLAYFGHTADTMITGPDHKRQVITSGPGSWTTGECELTLDIYSVTDLNDMMGDDSGTDRLLGDVNPWNASHG